MIAPGFAVVIGPHGPFAQSCFLNNPANESLLIVAGLAQSLAEFENRLKHFVGGRLTLTHDMPLLSVWVRNPPVAAKVVVRCFCQPGMTPAGEDRSGARSRTPPAPVALMLFFPVWVCRTPDLGSSLK